MNKTKIDWCDSTWNPITGCLHGCEYCYARNIAHRFGGFTELEDTDLDYEKICESNIVEIEKPLKYLMAKGRRENQHTHSFLNQHCTATN